MNVPRKRPNSVDAAWRKALANELNNNLFLDSPRGKTAFACGVAYVLERLDGKSDAKEWQRIFDDLMAFSDAYMAESATNMIIRALDAPLPSE
jgi:hypothetical protein